MSTVRPPSTRHDGTGEGLPEHSWVTDSRHPTSVGWVLYVRCTMCGTRRVDVQGHREAPPAPLSRVVGLPVRASS